MSQDLFGNFKNHDRFGFPEGIVRVTAGPGGESLLVLGSDKTALIDCGMAYCYEDLIKNMRGALKERPLDYICLSHTHYDHMGALPFIKETWPNAVTIASEHGKRVLGKEGAIKTICQLSNTAASLYKGMGPLPFPKGYFSVDQVVYDQDEIYLGKEKLVALETKGHTDCSLTYVLEPDKIMFLSESTGVLEAPGKLHVATLKSYKQSRESLEKCRAYGCHQLICPHYGLIPAAYTTSFWDLSLQEMEIEKEFLFTLFHKNLTDESILAAYVEKYWLEEREKEQPKEAFMLNAVNIIKAYKKDY